MTGSEARGRASPQMREERTSKPSGDGPMCRMVPCRQINTFPQKNSGHTYWNPIHTGLPVQYKLRSVSPPSDTTAAWQCFVWLWLVGTLVCRFN